MMEACKRFVEQTEKKSVSDNGYYARRNVNSFQQNNSIQKGAEFKRPSVGPLAVYKPEIGPTDEQLALERQKTIEKLENLSSSNRNPFASILLNSLKKSSSVCDVLSHTQPVVDKKKTTEKPSVDKMSADEVVTEIHELNEVPYFSDDSAWEEVF